MYICIYTLFCFCYILLHFMTFPYICIPFYYISASFFVLIPSWALAFERRCRPGKAAELSACCITSSVLARKWSTKMGNAHEGTNRQGNILPYRFFFDTLPEKYTIYI